MMLVCPTHKCYLEYKGGYPEDGASLYGCPIDGCEYHIWVFTRTIK